MISKASLAQGAYNGPQRPRVLVEGWQYPLMGSAVIGRAHVGCPFEDCRKKGFWAGPQILIVDNYRYIGKHHARLVIGSHGTCWIEDLNSLNGTAVLRASRAGQTQPYFHFQKLPPRVGYMLVNGDLVALAFSPHRGPYVTFSYHT